MGSLVGCTGGSGAVNRSTVPVADPSVSSSTPVPTTPAPKPSSPYPAGVALTGHNVKPGEKPPLYPAAAKQRTQDGANAFAEFFMRTLDWAYATTNPAYMKHYTAPSCGLCTGLATGIAKTATQRHWYLGGRLTVHPATRTAIAPVTAPADFCSAISVDITATSVVDRTGKVFNGQGALVQQSFKLCAKATKASWQATFLVGTT
jgi:hypothetical protein